MDALANLGIDWKLLLAQVVNFAILLWVLKRYAYKPMLALMDARSAKIEQGLHDAEDATKKLAEITAKEKEVLRTARTEAKSILSLAAASSKERDAVQLALTEEKVKHLLSLAEIKMVEDQAKMLMEAKNALAETVVLAVEKILKERKVQ